MTQWSPWSPRALAVTAAAWFTIALLSAATTVASRLRAGRAPAIEASLAEAAVACLVFAVLTPCALLVGQRWPVVRRHRSAIWIHLLGLSAYWLVSASLFVVAMHLLRVAPTPAFATVLASSAFGCLVAYVVSVGVAQSISAMLRLRHEETRQAELRAELARAQLEALAGQLRPHFLFNALNSVSALIHRDPAAADRLVVQLGSLLRLSIDRSQEPETPLESEVEFVALYLRVMEARIGPRLTVDWRIDDNVRQALVPQLLLLPLVENSLKHGIGPCQSAGHLRIAAYRDGDTLCITVIDDGCGIPPAGIVEGFGLSATRRRLAQVYDDRFALRVERCEPRGTQAVVVVPFRRHGDGRSSRGVGGVPPLTLAAR